MVVVSVDGSTHDGLRFLFDTFETWMFGGVGYLRAALISAGWMASPVLLPQLLRVCVMTAASSLSDRRAKDAIAVPVLPFNSSAICAALGPVTIFEPSSGGKAGGTPLPVAWWHATQLAA